MTAHASTTKETLKALDCVDALTCAGFTAQQAVAITKFFVSTKATSHQSETQDTWRLAFRRNRRFLLATLLITATAVATPQIYLRVFA